MNLNKLRQPKTFKDKLFRSFLLALAVPVMLLSLFVFIQTRMITQQTQEEALNDLLLQTERNLTTHIDDFRHSLSLLTENTAFQSALYTDNISMFDRYVFFRDTFDPSLTYIRITNPIIDRILFFTDSSYANQRLNILTLDDMAKFPLPTENLGGNNAQWVELDDETLGVFGGFPGSTSFHTFVLMTVKKKDLFPAFYANEGRVLGGVFSEEKQLYPTEHVDAAEHYQAAIDNTPWTLYLSKSSLPRTNTSFILVTLVAITSSIVIAYAMTRFFTRNINQEITHLKQRVRFALRDEPKNIVIEQQEEFFELSNDIQDMLEMVLDLQEENYHNHLESKDREYQAMINQINSHFLYNTLSAVNWHAVLSGQEEISYAIQLLSKYYRTTLNRGKNKILLQDELDNVQTYIDLQLFLHPDRFTVDYMIDEELLHVPIIHLLLQPIVENAIEHGFSQDLNNQLLSIKIQRETSDIFSIKIEDNGTGFNVQELDNILVAKTHGYGLSNINQRIKFYFGDKYGLLFDSSEGMGTLVTILLPILSGDSDIKEFLNKNKKVAR